MSNAPLDQKLHSTAVGKTAVVTGASSGIGQSTAHLLAQKGYDLLLIARSSDKLLQTKSLCSSNDRPSQKIKILSHDLKNPLNNKNLFDLLSDMAPLQVLINNAGIFHRENFENTSLDIWLEQFQVNLFGSVRITQALWPKLIQKRDSAIINVASTLGLKPTAGTSAYSAAKAAMINWTMNLAQEGAEFGLRANCVCPGIIDTPIHAFHSLAHAEKEKVKEQIAKIQLLPDLGNAEQVANAILFLASEQSRWTTGIQMTIDGGINIK